MWNDLLIVDVFVVCVCVCVCVCVVLGGVVGLWLCLFCLCDSLCLCVVVWCLICSSGGAGLVDWFCFVTGGVVTLSLEVVNCVVDGRDLEMEMIVCVCCFGFVV